MIIRIGNTIFEDADPMSDTQFVVHDLEASRKNPAPKDNWLEPSQSDDPIDINIDTSTADAKADAMDLPQISGQGDPDAWVEPTIYDELAHDPANRLPGESEGDAAGRMEADAENRRREKIYGPDYVPAGGGKKPEDEEKKTKDINCDHCERNTVAAVGDICSTCQDEYDDSLITPKEDETPEVAGPPKPSEVSDPGSAPIEPSKPSEVSDPGDAPSEPDQEGTEPVRYDEPEVPGAEPLRYNEPEQPGTEPVRYDEPEVPGEYPSRDDYIICNDHVNESAFASAETEWVDLDTAYTAWSDVESAWSAWSVLDVAYTAWSDVESAWSAWSALDTAYTAWSAVETAWSAWDDVRNDYADWEIDNTDWKSDSADYEDYLSDLAAWETEYEGYLSDLEAWRSAKEKYDSYITELAAWEAL